MNDISSWYDEDRAIESEIDWILHRHHDKILAWLLPKLTGIKSVIEFGCGSGIIAAMLPVDTYIGVDACKHFLRIATTRCPDWKFIQGDVRSYPIDNPFDLAMGWSFLKHFGIKEWADIVKRMLTHATHGAFNMQMLQYDLDDGTEYHHSHVTEARLASALKEAGHREIERTVLSEWKISERPAYDVAIWTERM